jgi:hypothetical protein
VGLIVIAVIGVLISVETDHYRRATRTDWWEWPGWEACVALGTLALAAGTGWLAWSTRRLAKQTQSDVEAQWVPVILPSVDPVQGQNANYWVPIENAGRGPALHGFVRWSDQGAWHGPFTLGPGGTRVIPIPAGVSGPITLNSAEWLTIEYESINGSPAYESRFLIAFDDRGRDQRRGDKGWILRIADSDYKRLRERVGPGPLAATNRIEEP